MELYMRIKNATDLLKAHLKYFIGETNKWIALFADNACMEYPYAPAIGLHKTLTGSQEIQKGRASFLETLENPVFKPLKLYELTDGSALGEYELFGKVKATGKVYRQVYVGILFSENGKIRLLREYYDPTQILRAFNEVDSLSLQIK
jgi:ketosteroid isomerase-like protein